MSAIRQPDLKRPPAAPAPSRRYVGFWRRVLHDQTSAGLTKVLGGMENVNVTLVPFHFGSQPRLVAVRGT